MSRSQRRSRSLPEAVGMELRRAWRRRDKHKASDKGEGPCPLYVYVQGGKYALEPEEGLDGCYHA